MPAGNADTEANRTGGETQSGQGKRFRLWVPAAIIGVSCALGLGLLFDWWPALRGIGWRWDYMPPSNAQLLRVAPALLVLAVYCAGLVSLRKRPDWLYLCWTTLGALAVPVSLLYLIGDPLFLLFSRTISQYATGAFAASLAITDPAKTLSDWPAMMPGIRESAPHMAISSPVWALIYYGLARVLAAAPTIATRLALPLISMACRNYRFLALDNAQIASTWLGIASPLWAGLTVVPLYALGAQLGSRRLARQAIAWWPLVPALALFAATLNSVYPLFTTTAVALHWNSLHELRRIGHLKRLAVGVLIGLLLLWNFSLVPLALLCGILTLFAWKETPRRDLRWLGIVGLEIAAGFLLVWGLYAILAGHSPLSLLAISLRIHTTIVRPYLPWLGLHTWDLVLFAGLPLCALAVAGAIVRREQPFRSFALALGLTLVILVLSGTARGETGRVWIFFMPLILLLTAGALMSLDAISRALLTGAQILWLIILAIVLRTILTGDVRLPPRYQEVALSPLQQPVTPAQAEFGHDQRLVGYQAEYQPKTRSLRLALHWQPLRPMRNPHYFSAVLVGPSGRVLPAVKWQPFETRYPTTCWYGGRSPEGEIVDQIDLPFGSDPMQGNWWVSLSAFDLADDQPPTELPVILPNGLADRQVGLGPLEVAAAH